MIYFSLPVAIIRRPEYAGADPVERATWLNLMAYCCEQENLGRIADCRKWKDRRWQQTCGVTLAEVENDLSELWNWDGDDLVVEFYPSQKQAEIEAKRIGGAKGGRRSKRTKQSPKAPAETPAQAPGKAHLEGELNSSPASSGQGLLITEEMKGECRKGNESGGDETHAAKNPPPPHRTFLEERQMSAMQVAERVMALRPEWSKPSALTAAELHDLTSNLVAFQSLSNSDWSLLRGYLAANHPAGAGFWKPGNRSRFIEQIADVLGHAMRWQEKIRPRTPVRATTDPSLK